MNKKNLSSQWKGVKSQKERRTSLSSYLVGFAICGEIWRLQKIGGEIGIRLSGIELRFNVGRVRDRIVLGSGVGESGAEGLERSRAPPNHHSPHRDGIAPSHNALLRPLSRTFQARIASQNLRIQARSSLPLLLLRRHLPQPRRQPPLPRAHALPIPPPIPVAALRRHQKRRP